jgi:hypothetical protein
MLIKEPPLDENLTTSSLVIDGFCGFRKLKMGRKAVGSGSEGR